MSKFLIFAAIAFINLAQAASWNPYLMNREKFLHLNEDQKQEVILHTMEFMAELESQYQHAVVTQGFNQKRYQEFIRVVRHVSSFLMNSAQAQKEGKDLSQIGKDFSQLLDHKKNRCLYGGWVSAVGKDGFCHHPGTLGPQSEIRKAYENASHCPAPGKISCNPVIFGYQNAESKSLFCVDAGVGKSHSSAYECMQKALDENPSDKKTDSKEKRLDYLKKQMEDEKNKDAFDGVHQYIMNACLCANKAPELNANYHKYMRPHRTCYAMMNSIKQMHENSSCAIQPEIIKTGFFDNLKGFVDKKVQIDRFGLVKKNTSFDETYSGLLSGDELTRYCNDEKDPGPETASPAPEEVEVKCEISLSVNKESKTVDASVSVTPPETSLSEIKWSGDVKGLDKTASYPYEKGLKVGYSFKANGKDVSCEQTLQEDEAETTQEDPMPALKVTGEAPGSVSKKINATIDGKSEIPTGFTLSWSRKGKNAADLGSNVLSIVEGLTGEEHQVCAKLQRTANQKSSEACESVPKMGPIAAPQPNQSMQPARPMPILRPPSNTLLQGID